MSFPNEVRQSMSEACNGYCEEDNCFEPIHSHHHMLNDCEGNRANYPLFINSPFNDKPLCYEGHKQRSHRYIISDAKAKVYEDWLRDLIIKHGGTIE